jgi:hypothetical protein
MAERNVMLAQMVDAFMAHDDMRYLEAIARLRDHVDRTKARRGRIRIGAHWFDPDIYAAWVKALAVRNSARGGNSS